MYPAVLIIHSILRYVVLLLAVAVIARALRGWLGKKPFEALDTKLGAAFMGSVHLQVVLGLLLHVALSPITQAAFAQMGTAMRDKMLRFWAVEHIAMGLLVAIIVTVARIASRKAKDDASKHRRAFIGYGIGLVIMFMMIPWPWKKAVGRGLSPFGASATAAP